MSILRDTIETVLPRNIGEVFDILDAHINERIGKALMLERVRLARGLDRISDSAYADAQYDLSNAVQNLANELRE